MLQKIPPFLILFAFSALCNAATPNPPILLSIDGTPPPPGGSSCSPMTAATGNIISVNNGQISELQNIIDSASSGDVVLFEDGVYALNGVSLWIRTPGISLRSASGNPDAVVLDGNYQSTEIITIAASNVTIAEITIQKAFTHPIHVVATGNVDTINTNLYRLKIFDAREQAIKINTEKQGGYSDNGTLACSSITLTDTGRPLVNPDTGGCYTGGIDAHQARGWSVRDNLIEGFWCNTGLAEHAIHFWRGGRDNIVERNVLRNNARGVGFGLTDNGTARTYSDNYCSQTTTPYIGHYGGIIRNNTIHVSSQGLLSSAAGFDCGICLASACKAIVVHNSIVSTGNTSSSIEWRFSGSSEVEIMNNLTSHSLRARNGGSASLSGNLENANLNLFVNASSGDLHLSPNAASAIDKGTPLAPGLSDFDFENDVRDSTPDIGADEI